MCREEIYIKLTSIFRDVFDDDSICINDGTTPDDIEDWDSIGHTYLMVEIEDEFAIKLGDRVTSIKCVKDIVELIEEKTTGAN